MGLSFSNPRDCEVMAIVELPASEKLLRQKNGCKKSMERSIMFYLEQIWL